MKNTQFSAKCRYCIAIHQGALSRAALGVSKAFLFILCLQISIQRRASPVASLPLQGSLRETL